MPKRFHLNKIAASDIKQRHPRYLNEPYREEASPLKVLGTNVISPSTRKRVNTTNTWLTAMMISQKAITLTAFSAYTSTVS